MLKLLKTFWRHQRLSFFAAKVSGALYDLGIDRKELPSEPFNSFCDSLFEKAESNEAAGAFFCANFSQFPKAAYTLPIGGYDLIFRASKIIGIWQTEALIPAASAIRMIQELEEVCKMIEAQNPKLFSNKAAQSAAKPDNTPPLSYPAPDRSNFNGNQGEGVLTGFLKDNRPYRIESWSEDHNHFVTVFFSILGIEKASPAELLELVSPVLSNPLLVPEKRRRLSKDDVHRHKDARGNEMYSLTFVVILGSEDN